MPVYVDKFALAKTHVSLIGERRWRTHGVSSSSATSNVRQTHHTVEVRDLGWIINVCQWNGGIQGVVVDDDSEGLKGCAATRN